MNFTLQKEVNSITGLLVIKPNTSYRIDVLVVNADGVSRNITKVIKTVAN